MSPDKRQGNLSRAAASALGHPWTARCSAIHTGCDPHATPCFADFWLSKLCTLPASRLQVVTAGSGMGLQNGYDVDLFQLHSVWLGGAAGGEWARRGFSPSQVVCCKRATRGWQHAARFLLKEVRTLPSITQHTPLPVDGSMKRVAWRADAASSCARLPYMSAKSTERADSSSRSRSGRALRRGQGGGVVAGHSH